VRRRPVGGAQLARASSQSAQPAPASWRNTSGSAARYSRATATMSRARARRAARVTDAPLACSPRARSHSSRARTARSSGRSRGTPAARDDPRRAPARLPHAVGHAGEPLRQVQRGVAVVVHAEQQHLPVEIVHAPDWASRDVRWERQRVGDDALGRGTSGGEREEMRGAAHAREAPERVRDNPRSCAAGVRSGSNGSSSRPVHDGITSVPSGPSASRSAAMSPEGLPRPAARPGTKCGRGARPAPGRPATGADRRPLPC
jgi:hypothetical protein